MADDDSMSDDDNQLDVKKFFFFFFFLNLFLQIPDNTKHIASIQLGQVDIDCWYHSPYINVEDGSNEKNCTIEKLYICEYCLRYFLNNKNYQHHTVDIRLFGNRI
jgi:hypothetical protein